MATALEIAQITVNRATQNYFRGGMSYCQQFAGNFWETVMGRATPNSYTSAKNAMNASGGLNGDYNAAPPERTTTSTTASTATSGWLSARASWLRVRAGVLTP